jgi:hypothetical protein
MGGWTDIDREIGSQTFEDVGSPVSFAISNAAELPFIRLTHATLTDGHWNGVRVGRWNGAKRRLAVRHLISELSHSEPI